MANRAIIIGIGNSLRGDDGIAAEVLRRLEAENIAADCQTVQHLTVEMAQVISRYDAVLFVDASVALPVGHWRSEMIDHYCDGNESFSHDLSPKSLVDLSTHLYGSRIHAQVISIGAVHFDYTEAVSPELIGLLPMILDFIRAWVVTLPDSNNHSMQELISSSPE